MAAYPDCNAVDCCIRKRRGTRKDKEKYCFSMEHILTNADIRLDIGILLDLDASLSFS